MRKLLVWFIYAEKQKTFATRFIIVCLQVFQCPSLFLLFIPTLVPTEQFHRFGNFPQAPLSILKYVTVSFIR